MLRGYVKRVSIKVIRRYPICADSLGKWTYKSPVFLGENQEFSIFWPKNRAFFPITTGTYKSITLDWRTNQSERENERFFESLNFFHTKG